MNTLLQDLRYGWRMLRRSPSFALTAVVTLALGIGGNAVVFSILNALYLRPAPVHDPGNVVISTQVRGGISPVEYKYYRDHSRSFSALAAQYPTAHTYLVSDQVSKMVMGNMVSSNYFSMLGLVPVHGRFFLPEDDSPGKPPVAVIGYDLWQSDFAGDPSLIGRTVRLNNVPATVVGIAPRDFHGVFAGIDNQVWMPFSAWAAAAPSCKSPEEVDCEFLDGIVGRLDRDRAASEAQAELNGLGRQFESEYPQLGKTVFSVSVARGLRPEDKSRVAQLPVLLLATVGGLLLIGCANLAGLLLARGASRSKEIAIRMSLGAERLRIVRQLLTEASILAVTGGAAGLLMVQVSKGWLSNFPFIENEGFKTSYAVGPDLQVILWATGLSFVTIFVFALIPALRSSAPAPLKALKGSAFGTTSRSRLRSFLVVGQVAVALALTTSAVLVVGSLDRVLAGRAGDPTHIAILRVSPYRLGYTPAQSAKEQQDALRRIAALPGVESVSLGRYEPWWKSGRVEVSLSARETDSRSPGLRAFSNPIAPGYLKTLSIPLLEGREFTDHDLKDTPRVVIVNATLASHMWPKQDALGQTLHVNNVLYSVVGVARDVQYDPASVGSSLFVYTPYWQNEQERSGADARLVVRTSGDAAAMLPEIRQAVHELDTAVPIGEDSTLEQGLLMDFGPLRITRAVLSFAGSTALFLSMLGLYGVLSFLVAQQTREIGIRLALGETQTGVLKLFLGKGLRLACMGVLVGTLLSIAGGRLLSSVLYGVNARDPLMLVSVPLILLAVALLASLLPARRAAAVDPMVALRYE